MTDAVQNPLFSVITAVHNGHRTIGETISTLIAQTEPSWEQIIIDNGSTDGTEEVVAAQEDLRIRYQYEPERGRSRARNKGIQLARGKFLLFLDADDWLLPNALSDHIRFFDRHPRYGVSVSDGHFCTDSGKEIVSFSERRGKVSAGNVLPRLVIDSGLIGAPVCVAVRREVVRRHAVSFHEDLYIGEDWLFWIEVAALTEFGFLESKTCKYRWHADNTTLGAGERRRGQQLAMVRQKAASAPYFKSLPDDVRREFFYQLLMDALKDNPEEQEKVIVSDHFANLSPSVQAALIRIMACARLAAGDSSDSVRRLLRLSHSAGPSDWKTLVVSSLLAIHPKLAQLAVRGRKSLQKNVGDPLLAMPSTRLP